jgi:hypothetical protein
MLEEDKLLNKLKSEIEGDLTPVRPVLSPGIRSALFFPIWAALGAFSILVFGLREDYAQLGGWGTFGLAGAQLFVAGVLVLVGMRNSIPGMMTSSGLSWVAAALSLVLFLLTSGLVYSISPVAPPPGMFVGKALACLSFISLMGVAPLVLGLLLISRGLPLRVGVLGIVIGLGSGLGTEAAWRLHCAYSDWGHILVAHGGGLMVVLALGLAGVWYLGSSRFQVPGSS